MTDPKDRRKSERILFKNVLRTFLDSPTEGLITIDLSDISQEGLSFIGPHTLALSAESQTPLRLRIYLSHDTYLVIEARVKNKRTIQDGSKTKLCFGCAVNPLTRTYPGYSSLVRFIKDYVEYSELDLGEAPVS